MNHKILILMISSSFFLMAGYTFAQDVKHDNSWWWSDAWWNDGKIEVPTNYDVETSWIEYTSDDVDVPAMVVRPRKKGKYPAVLFQHGRRGLDDLVQRHASAPGRAWFCRAGT